MPSGVSLSSTKSPGKKAVKKPFKIAFTYNLKPENISKDDPDAEFYAEFDTPHTIEGIRKAIEANGYEVIMVEANESAFDKFRQHRDEIGLVFNFSEAVSNGLDREAHIPAMLEILKLPYTGPAPLAAAMILDKARAKEVWSYHGVPNAAFQLFRSKDEPLKAGLSFPLIVKPTSEGSSTGIRDSSVVKNEKELRSRVAEILHDFEQPALVEKFLPGREFTVSLIGNGDKLESLPLVEVNFESFPKGVNRIDSYEAKWVWDDPSNPIDAVICPAKVDSALGKKVVDVAKRAFLAIGCRDWARVDVRLDDKGEPYVIEINCPVGLLPDPKENSRMPTAALAAGIGFSQLLGKIISTALERCGKV
jgi:D-alanine-D-alanine ligase